MKTTKKNHLYKGKIDKNDAEFAIINRATLHELSLRIPERNVTARMVYILLLTYANKKGVCWPSHSTLAKILNVNRDAVVKAYKTLKELGFIKTKNSPATKSLKVQMYCVPHKLIFNDNKNDEQGDVDDFPDKEEDFTSNISDNPADDKKICMPEHTSKCMPEDTGACMSETNSCVPGNTQTDYVTHHVKQPDENTTPPQAHLSVRLNPPLGDSVPSGVKPSIPLNGSDILDIYEYGKKFPVLGVIEDNFIKEQIPEVQCIFIYTMEWNIYWGFDISDMSFSKKDVSMVNELLSFNSYDELMEDIQAYAEWLGTPEEVVNISDIWGFLLQDLHHDWDR
ncbi:Helix-turn-helix domain-containing protein [Tangfeifania diversioriginum]|uniref:Helix-turn-helix domain-containing protein n=1 Tax=Tangfeifania diversioriginum TaxID=1168035 RepID=A0A1M6JN29_9BACT|nr:helix-turn-helix domain-containing protein [Tangfeifania diversioriginum]SHJ48024.1 Helix-turn-helix domain-containing protein [Tangfeifania diversioriginum]